MVWARRISRSSPPAQGFAPAASPHMPGGCLQILANAGAAKNGPMPDFVWIRGGANRRPVALVHFSPPQRSPVFAGSLPACEGAPQARTPAPAASSAKRAVPRPRFLTRIAVIEHSSVLFLPCCACSACVLFLPCCACCCRRRRRRRRRRRARSAAHLLWPRGLSAAAKSEPRRAAPQNKGQFHVNFLKKNGQLGCHNNKWVQPDGTM